MIRERMVLWNESDVLRIYQNNKGINMKNFKAILGFVSISWVMAMILVLLWAFNIVGAWGLGVAVGCAFLPYILTVISSVFVAIAVMLGRKNK